MPCSVKPLLDWTLRSWIHRLSARDIRTTTAALAFASTATFTSSSTVASPVTPAPPNTTHTPVRPQTVNAMAVETTPLMAHAEGDIPRAPWATALASPRDPSRRLPQAIAHRGAKVSWPENTMAAFRSAVEVGAHAIETDVHLAADGVVILSHDPSLKRCYGVDKKVAECNWEYLKTLRTVREPKEPLPRFKDLLEWLASPGLEKIWIVLDIKMDDDPEELVGAIARTLEEAPGPVPWDQRIVLGCWNASFLKASRRLLPTHPLAHISTSLLYSHYFLGVPNLGFNLHHKALLGFPGSLFLREIQRSDRLLMAWTVNEPRWMEWCIRKNLLRPRKDRPKTLEDEGEDEGEDESESDAIAPALIDGVITDDPKLYLDVCERFEDELDGKRVRPPRGLIGWVKDGLTATWTSVRFQVLVMGFYLVRRAQGRFDFLDDRKSLEARAS
ncbi:PLC-like phosphodiesterase [Dactylonectria macrodidyma]|uniref:PLC-like phosphodiesterase n=1 Tax=Dactylonectria macrodidyma TaxID=307937 RepID=A0A9P9EYG2_9HYPO|nr:PLC-like phosphodiesterase [Dactylonectria macrodidyma]